MDSRAECQDNAPAFLHHYVGHWPAASLDYLGRRIPASLDVGNLRLTDQDHGRTGAATCDLIGLLDQDY